MFKKGMLVHPSFRRVFWIFSLFQFFQGEFYFPIHQYSWLIPHLVTLSHLIIQPHPSQNQRPLTPLPPWPILVLYEFEKKVGKKLCYPLTQGRKYLILWRQKKGRKASIQIQGWRSALPSKRSIELAKKAKFNRQPSRGDFVFSLEESEYIFLCWRIPNRKRTSLTKSLWWDTDENFENIQQKNSFKTLSSKGILRKILWAKGSRAIYWSSRANFEKNLHKNLLSERASSLPLGTWTLFLIERCPKYKCMEFSSIWKWRLSWKVPAIYNGSGNGTAERFLMREPFFGFSFNCVLWCFELFQFLASICTFPLRTDSSMSLSSKLGGFSHLF